MAYNEELAVRTRAALQGVPGIVEKKMFGGMAFMVSGNMACGIVGDELMVRVGKERYEEYLALPHAREMTFTGKSMRGMIYVDAAGIGSEEGLQTWVERGVAFAGSLPPK